MARILIVEDEIAQRNYIATLLRHHNYEPIPAEDPRSILELVEEIKPDLILIDVVLPGLSGLAAATLIRNNPALAQIPIVAMSGHRIGRDELVRAGATDFVEKPFRGEVLINAIKRALGEEPTERKTEWL
jgi:CheY-like chemotaxis protein